MTTFTLRALLRDLSDQELLSIHGRWTATRGEPAPRPRLLGGLARQMADGDRVLERMKELPEKLAGLVEGFLAADRNTRDVRGILDAGDAVFRSRYELEASLVALQREGFVFPVEPDERGRSENWAMPHELASCIADLRHRQRTELIGTLSLKGFLQQRYYEREQRQDGSDGTQRASDHARRVYKLYLMDSSIRTRVQGLQEEVRQVFERCVTSFGGVMPADEIRRLCDEEELDVDVDLVKKCLEDAMLGTVAPLRLARFGIEPIDRAVVVFHEIGMHWLSAGDESGSTRAEQALSSGVDLVTNVGRFLREVATTKVQFTVEGHLYKASARRIVKGFLPVPGGYMPPDTQARFIYGFCRSRRLVERSGERALRLSAEGLDFEHRSLQEKLRALLSFAVEERAPQGEHYHQVRLRKILLRLLRRLDPEQWLEAPYVPFLARNAYLGKLDELRVEEFFAARFKGGGYVPTETAQQLCLHLLDWVRRRLFPLGLVDLGLREGRPVLMRLSRLGAELLGNENAGELGGHRSSLVVNPDFEVILFPGDDEPEAVHALDQLCERLKTDHIHHFRMTRESLQAALNEGTSLASVVQELTDRSRSALPQNVLYNLEDWADQAGVLLLDEDRVLRGRKSEIVERFAAHPRLATVVARRIDENRLALKPDADIGELREVARDLGFLIELEGAAR